MSLGGLQLATVGGQRRRFRANKILFVIVDKFDALEKVLLSLGTEALGTDNGWQLIRKGDEFSKKVVRLTRSVDELMAVDLRFPTRECKIKVVVLLYPDQLCESLMQKSGPVSGVDDGVAVLVSTQLQSQDSWF